MQSASAARDDANLSNGSDELAEGLMLVRASTLKIIRLQLAIERRDHRVALETVDDLIALDHSLEQLLAQASATGEGLFKNVLELERSALNIEKHTLAAGISSRNWAKPEPTVAETAESEALSDWAICDEEDEPSQSRWLFRATILFAFLIFAGAAFLLGESGLVPNLVREVL